MIETPIPESEPQPEGVVEGEPDIAEKEDIDEMIETPVPEPEKIDIHAETNIAEAIPESEEFPEAEVDEEKKVIDARPEIEKDPKALDVVTIDEHIAKAEGEKKPLKVFTTGDLKPKPKPKSQTPHNPEDDTFITTKDFKPQKWGKSKKL